MGAQVITLLGAKGGEGTTFLAVNLAVDFRRLTNRKVLLIDLCLPFGGGVNFLLGLETSRTMVDLAAVLPSLDPALLRGYMTRHDSGIEVLASSLDSSEELPLSAEDVGRLIDLLVPVYDFIVVDGGSAISERLLAVLDRSHGVGIVMTVTLPALHQARRLLRYLQDQHFSRERIHIIASMTGRRGNAIDPRTAEQNLKRNFLAAIPADAAAAATATADQVPLCTSDPRHVISKAVSDLSLALVGAKGTGDGLLGQVSLQVRSPRDATPSGGQKSGRGALRGEVERGGRGRDGEGSDPAVDARRVALNAIKEKVHARLFQKLDLRRIDVDVTGDPDKARLLRDETLRAVVEILDEEAAGLLSRADRRRVAREIIDEALGLGPLEDLLQDPTITEIMVNRADRIYVERGGRIELTEASFISNRQLLGAIERIVSPLGRRIDESNPFVDARLPDGSRVNAVIPPISIDGPMLTIRKFSQVPFLMKDLVRFGSATDEMSLFFQAAVVGRLNILISGGTGSGKTTLLNVLSGFIPGHERILTIEDAAELQLPQENVGRLEARPANIEGEGEVTIRDLVRNALRMRPDRIVVGECRGGEALDMLQAMNTGHDGSLTTIHANSPRDSLSRLETMVLFTGLELPSRAVRDQIAAAIDIIVQTTRFSLDGSRRVTHVSHVQRLAGTEFLLKDIFIFRQTGTSESGQVQGRFIPTGYVPPFVHDFSRRGIHLPLSVFKVKDHVDLQLLREWRQEAEQQPAEPAALPPAP